MHNSNESGYIKKLQNSLIFSGCFRVELPVGLLGECEGVYIILFTRMK